MSSSERGVVQTGAGIDPEKGYVKDDSVTLEVYVKADAPHGVRSASLHDVYFPFSNFDKE